MRRATRNLIANSPNAVGVVAAASIVSYTFKRPITSALFLTVLLMLIFFYRDPEIKIAPDDGRIMSPAWGKVVSTPEKNGTRSVIIFLSPLDIHVQRVPVYGTVTSKIYDATGKYKLAYKIEKSDENEKIMTTFDTPKCGTVLVRQIAGKFVRRIVNPLKVGQQVQTGQSMGMIKFGSRVDVEMDTEMEVTVKVGDYVTPDMVIAISVQQ